jgi:hypothetical protein
MRVGACPSVGLLVFKTRMHTGEARRPTSSMATNFMSRDTYAPRAARCPTTRTGMGLADRRTR